MQSSSRPQTARPSTQGRSGRVKADGMPAAFSSGHQLARRPMTARLHQPLERSTDCASPYDGEEGRVVAMSPTVKVAAGGRDVKREALLHIRKLERGRGDAVEKETALSALSGCLQRRELTHAWLADQGNVVENVVSLAEMGTPAQRDSSAVLLCMLSDSSISTKLAILRTPRVIPALLRLLRGSVDVQRVNAAATVWFLAEIDEFRASVESCDDDEMLTLLVGCIDSGTSPQSEHASGALRMLTFEHEHLAQRTLQSCQRLPEILLNAAKSESLAESLQAVSLIAQLSSFENVSFHFRSIFAALDDSIECLVRILQASTRRGGRLNDRAGHEIKMQAAISLRNLLILPEVREMSRTITGLIPACLFCFTESEGMLRIRMLGVLKAMADDQEMKLELARNKDIYPVLLAMMKGGSCQPMDSTKSGNSPRADVQRKARDLSLLDVDHSLTFLNAISQETSDVIACHDIIFDVVAILMRFCSDEKYPGRVETERSSATSANDAVRIKAAAVIRNLACNDSFSKTMAGTEGFLQILENLLSGSQSGCRQVLSALRHLSAHETSAALILSFPNISQSLDEEIPETRIAKRDNTIVKLLLSLSGSPDEWICVQSVRTLQNLTEKDIDFRIFEAEMVQQLEGIVLRRKELGIQTKVTAALAMASLTSRVSACRLITKLPDCNDARIFALLLGLGRAEAQSQESIVGLWALCNIAAVEENTEKKFTEVDFLLDRIGRFAASGRDGEKVAAAAVIKNLCVHSAISADYLGALPGVIESLYSLAMSTDVAVYEHALGALCMLTTQSVKNRMAPVHGGLLCSSATLAVKACACLTEDHRDIMVYGAGLLCNMAAANGIEDTTAELGRCPNIFENLCSAMSSSDKEVRINAISALCNLAHHEVNKIRIGGVQGCLETLNQLLHSGSDAEKAQACMLVFYLSFIFKNNAQFGELSGALDCVLDLLRHGNDEQVENAAAALSILACNSKNAEWLTSGEKRPILLQTLATTFKNGNARQRVNIVVSMWNISANSVDAKHDLGKVPSLFVLLVNELMVDRTSELAQQTVGLLSELLHQNERNANLFGKVHRGVELLLDMSFDGDVKPEVQLNACWGVANFAGGDDDRLRVVMEMEGGLTALCRLIGSGNEKQQEFACALLSSDVLKSMAGRAKMIRVPGLVSTLIDVCTNFEDDRRRYSAQVLSNFAAGPSTRPLLCATSGIVKAMETAIADPKSSKLSQYFATKCIASLCLDPMLKEMLGDWESTHGLLLDNLTGNDIDLVDSAAEAFHNLVVSSVDNQTRLLENQGLVDRIMQLAGEGKGRAAMMHSVGTLYQLVRASKTFSHEMTRHPTIAGQLVKALHHGSDKAKELACAILAILGENDDDIGSVEDDVINMQITMCEGSFDVLQELFIRGTPSQAMHANAVISNILISAGSFMKSKLAENEDFMRTLVHFTASTLPLHRTYAVRLLYHMMKEDNYIIETVGQFPKTIPIMMEMLNSGNKDQRRYAALCIVQLASEENIAKHLGTYNKGHIFKEILRILEDRRSLLQGQALEILRMLTTDDANKEVVVKFEGLVEYLARVACSGSKEHSTSALGILTQLSEGNQELRTVLANNKAMLAALSRLLEISGHSRERAALLIFVLAQEREHLANLAGIANVFDTLGSMIVHGDSRDQDAACQALCKLLHHDDSSLKDLAHASQVVKKLVALMEEEDENGFALATSKQEEYFLMAMLQMCKDDYGCTVVSLVPGVFRMLIKHAGRDGLGDGLPWVALRIITKLMHSNPSCWTSLLEFSTAIPVFLDSLRAHNRSQIEDAISVLLMLSGKSSGYQHHITDVVKEKGDPWDSLLSFLDEKLIDDRVFNRREDYEIQRQKAFAILTMLAAGNKVVCDRISQKRFSSSIISRGIVNTSGASRQAALRLSIECSAMNDHFAKKLGSESNFLTTLTSTLDTSKTMDADHVFSVPDQKLSLTLLSILCRNEQHCRTVGSIPGIFINLFTLIQRGLDSRSKLRQSRPQKDSSVVAVGDEEAKIESGVDEDDKSVDPEKKLCASAVLHIEEADVDDERYADIEAATMVLTLINNDMSTVKTLVRVPFSIVDTLLMQAVAEEEQHRKHSLSIMWRVAMTSESGRELLGKNGPLLMRTLTALCDRHPEHIEEVLFLLADLVRDKKCKLALLSASDLVEIIVQAIGKQNPIRLAVSGIRVIEVLANAFVQGKLVLGRHDSLMRNLMKIKYGANEALAESASAAMEQLTLECDENAGVFRRLRPEFAN